MSSDSDGAKLAKEFAKEKQYPPDYKGPKAGRSSDEEWQRVRDYDAFKFIKDGVWSYSDFDCYLYAMCDKFRKIGNKEAENRSKEIKNYGI